MNRKGLISFLFFIFCSCFIFASDSIPPLRNRVIAIDAGHGVINFQNEIINAGQSGYFGQIEHRVNFDIAQRLGESLRKEGAKVIYTRDPVDYWRQSYSAVEDNKNRALFANEVKADVLLSIHCDWDHRPKINGITTLYEKKTSRRLGAIIHKNLVRELKAKDRMLVNDNFTILDHAQMPALIIETGFLSNRNEARKLSTPQYRDKLVAAITKGLKTFFNE